MDFHYNMLFSSAFLSCFPFCAEFRHEKLLVTCQIERLLLLLLMKLLNRRVADQLRERNVWRNQQRPLLLPLIVTADSVSHRRCCFCQPIFYPLLSTIASLLALCSFFHDHSLRLDEAAREGERQREMSGLAANCSC